MSSVISLKLSTGEEIICKSDDAVNLSRGTPIRVSKPMVLHVMQAPGGGFGLGLVPWVHSQNFGEIPIEASHIAAVLNPDKEMVDAYLSQTSGIQIAKSGSSFLAE